ncbi:MAG: InlB B-repeat-containing protein [Lachnospiraceae bacterium]|nr:InlB B-repeat-containing protein [Lachnospiraceae bacterium]
MNRKTGWKWRILGLFMAVLVGLGMFSVSASAEGEETGTESGTESSLSYLALGDSITDGYGLGTEDSSFVDIFAEKIGATETTRISSSDGLTASQLFENLDDSNLYVEIYQEAIESADVITITIGGNDLMEGFYEVIAELYSAYTVSMIDADDVKAALKDPDENSGMVDALLTYIDSLTDDALGDISGQFGGFISNCISEITQITGFIQEKNPDAVILVANQYNPYQWLGNEKVSNLFADVTKAYNSNLAYLSAYYGIFTVVDISSAFSDTEYESTSLTNASVSVSYDPSAGISYSYDFDFHPNAAGHGVIATTMYNAYVAATSQVYTVEIPIEVNVETDGSAAAPEESFTIQALVDYYDATSGNSVLIDVSSKGAVYSVNTVSTDGKGTYKATLTFTCGEVLASSLTDGFYVSLFPGDSSGWTYDDDSEYEIKYINFDADGNQTGCSIYDVNDQTETELSAVSFTCTYTGYTLSFNTNGGSEIGNVEAATGTEISLANYTTTCNGYTFTGWYLDEALTDKVDSVILTSNTTVYAGWTENTYTWTVPLKITADKGGSVDVPAQTLTVGIYDLSGNEIDISAYGGTMLSNTVSVTGEGEHTGELEFTGGVGVYNKLSDGFYVALKEGASGGWSYDKTVYSVNVYFDDETLEASEIAIKKDEDITIVVVALAAGEKVNAAFTTLTQTKARVMSLAATYSGETAVSFTCSYTGWYLNFEANGGSSVASVTAVDGETISLSGYTTSRSGYDFTGWYADNAFSTKATNATMNGDVTVYAGWTEVTQTTEEPTEDDDSSDSNDDTDNEESTVTAATTESVSAVSAESADTGDDNHIVLWAVLVIVLGAGVAALTVFQRKRH